MSIEINEGEVKTPDAMQTLNERSSDPVFLTDCLRRCCAPPGWTLVELCQWAAGRLTAETPADALRVLAEVRRRVHEMKERHIPGLFTDEMARLGELMATVLGPESPPKTAAKPSSTPPQEDACPES